MRNASEGPPPEACDVRDRHLVRVIVCATCLAAAIAYFIGSSPETGRVGFPVAREYFVHLLIAESIAVTAACGGVVLSRRWNADAIKMALAGTLLGTVPAAVLNLTLFQRARDTGWHVFGEEDVFRIARGILIAWAFGLAFRICFRLLEHRSALATSTGTDRTAT